MDSNVDIVARTICGEARGEGQAGMEDVACVIMNRAHKAKLYYALHGKPHPLFGDGSPASACKAPEQFSCWNPGDPNLPIIENLDDTYAIFREAIDIATQAVNGNLSDRTNGATHYFAAGIPLPFWAQGKTPCFQEGKHIFFNNIS